MVCGVGGGGVQSNEEWAGIYPGWFTNEVNWVCSQASESLNIMTKTVVFINDGWGQSSNGKDEVVSWINSVKNGEDW